MNVERIQKLLKLLSSDNDGEALAAVHALKRVLAQEGGDIHGLADSIGGLSEAEMQKLYDAGFQKGKETANFTDVEIKPPSFYEMACEIQHSHGGCYRWALSEKEVKFIDDMVRWCARREPSEKQGRWLHAIYCKVGRRR